MNPKSVLLCLIISVLNNFICFGQGDSLSIAQKGKIILADSVLRASQVDTSMYPLSLESTQFSFSGNYSEINGAVKYAFLASTGMTYSVGKSIRLPITASFIYSSVNQVLQQREIYVVSMPTYKPDKGKVRYYADVEFEQSYIRSINSRISSGLGAGYVILGNNNKTKDKSELVISSFLLYEYTSIYLQDIDDNYAIHALRVSTRLKWRMFIFPGNRFSITGYSLYAPRFYASNVYKLAISNSMNYKLWKGLSLIISYDYLSEQFLTTGNRKTSTIASAGFSLTL